MKICVLGWYGTETLGDRAILDGILKIFSNIDKKCLIYLGSLYPFFSEHSMLLDYEIYKETFDDLKINIFNEKNNGELTKCIKQSDIVIMGGGPIMDLNELYVVKKGFSIAKKYNVKTCLFGCGYGPLNNDEFKDVFNKILKLTDLAIYRDTISMSIVKKEYIDIPSISLPDPAIISIESFIEKNKRTLNKNNDLIINLREHPMEYANNGFNNFNDKLISLIDLLSKKYDNVIMIPMHTFFIGGDDRCFLNKIKNKCETQNNNIRTINKPMSLYDLYELYSNANTCIGMRYHSVVMQTLLNGNNYIIDYTDPIKGKIIGFLKENDKFSFYKDRYYNYTTKNEEAWITFLNSFLNKERYIYNSELKKHIKDYTNMIKEFLL